MLWFCEFFSTRLFDIFLVQSEESHKTVLHNMNDKKSIFKDISNHNKGNEEQSGTRPKFRSKEKGDGRG